MPTPPYVAGQVLTAAELNASFAERVLAASAAITGGTIEGLTHLYITGTDASTSPITGALTVVGGAGIGGDINGGGKINAASDITSAGNIKGVNGLFTGITNVGGKIVGLNGTNLLPNSSGEFGNLGWASTFFAAGVGVAGQGPIFMNGSAITVASQDGQQVGNIGAATPVVISAEILASGVVAGRAYVSVEAFNSSNASLGVIALATIANGQNGLVTASGTTPAGTSYVKVWKGVDTSPNVPVGGLIFRRLKLETGTTASLYSQEASVAASTGNQNGELSINGALGNQTLTADQFTNAIFKVSGVLTANIIITVPATPHNFVVQNITTGSFNVTFIAAGQTPTAIIVQGKAATLFSDATGVYATSSAAGLSFAGVFAFSGNQTLTITHIGSMVTQSAASVTTLPKASTVQAGSGVGFANVDALATDVVSVAVAAGDTADLPFPFQTQPNDVFFWYSDGVSKWKLGWYSNKFTPAFQTSITAPKVLANTTDNTIDALQAGGSVGATGTGGTLRATPPLTAGSTPGLLSSSALGLDLSALGANVMRFFTNAVERMRIVATGRVLINKTVDNGVDQLQVNGSIQTSTGITFPDGTSQVTAMGGTQATSTLFSIALGNATLGGTTLVTTGFANPFVQLYKNGLRLTLGVDFTLNADNKTINLLTYAVSNSDTFEALTGFTYNPSQIYVPTSQLFTPAFGAASIAVAYTVGFVFLYRNGVRLVPGVDYSALNGTSITFLTFLGDGVTQYEAWLFTAVTPANVVSATNPILQGILTFSDGTVQGSAAPGKNRLINGACLVGQWPSLSYTVGINGYAGPDRWNASNAATSGAFTQSQGTMVIAGVTKYAVVQTVTTAIVLNTTSAMAGIRQRIEAFNTYDLCGRPIAVSFWWNSNVSGQFSVSLNDAAGNSYVTTFTSVANVNQKVVILVPANSSVYPASNATGISLNIGYVGGPTNTAVTSTLNVWQNAAVAWATGSVNWGATVGNYISVTEIKLEAGTAATPFMYEDVELTVLKCQRYYQILQLNGYGYGTAGVQWADFFNFSGSMRATPTAILLTAGSLANASGFVASVSQRGAQGSATVTATGAASFTNYIYGYSAEL